nr:sporamin B [Ipomoea batatas]GME08224.1 sporamin B [Ipomoea batatas]
MKTLALLFFTLSLFLLPNPTHSTRNPIRLPTADVAAASGAPVLDSDGDELRAGGTYYIVSVIRAFGGVKLVRLDSATGCASDVIIAHELDKGNPVMITPEDPNATVVLQSTHQSLRFSIPTSFLCVFNVSWEVQKDPISGEGFVKAGDVVSYKFMIEQDTSLSPTLNAYKITHCPFDICYNLGLYFDELVGARRLALSDYPHAFVFQKSVHESIQLCRKPLDAASRACGREVDRRRNSPGINFALRKTQDPDRLSIISGGQGNAFDRLNYRHAAVALGEYVTGGCHRHSPPTSPQDYACYPSSLCCTVHTHHLRESSAERVTLEKRGEEEPEAPDLEFHREAEARYSILTYAYIVDIEVDGYTHAFSSMVTRCFWNQYNANPYTSWCLMADKCRSRWKRIVISDNSTIFTHLLLFLKMRNPPRADMAGTEFGAAIRGENQLLSYKLMKPRLRALQQRSKTSICYTSKILFQPQIH